MEMYKLGSSPMIGAPGIVRWAINGYRAARMGERARLVKLITEGWPGVTERAANALLSEAVPYTVTNDGAVKFEVAR